MAYKGIGVVFLRKELRARGAELEQRFLKPLTFDEAHLFKVCVPGSRIPDEANTKFYEGAAPLLYPSDPKPLRALGRAMARENLTGIYKIFLQLATVPFIISQTARLWHTYHEKGWAKAEKDPAGNRGVLTVFEFPDFSPCMREILCGYIAGTLELTGTRNLRLVMDESDPQAWRWILTWD